MVTIKIILGSTRPNRFGIQPANWLMEQSKKIEGARFELIDLAEVNLPLLDEATPPMRNQYTKEHTKQWSKLIEEADGFVYVTAEYNHSIPAALKNAIDYLYFEWNHKPVSYLSYGSAAGGSRAVEQLRGVAAELKMFDLHSQIMLSSYYATMDDKGQYQFSKAQEEQAAKLLTDTVFWAESMKRSRKELLNRSITNIVKPKESKHEGSTNQPVRRPVVGINN